MSKLGRVLRLFLVVCLSSPLLAQEGGKPATAPDSSKQAYVYEDVVDKTSFENDGTGAQEITARVRITSVAGVQALGVVKFSYQNLTGTIEIPYVRVRKPDGTTVVTPPDYFQDMPADITRQAPFYSDLREKHVAVKGLSVGDVLEYQYRLRYTKPLAPGQFWFEYNFIRDTVVLHEQLQVSVPQNRQIKLKSKDLSPTIETSGGRRTYTWNRANPEVKTKSDDENMQLAVDAGRGRIDQPDIRLSSFQNWDELGKWYDGLQEERIKPSPEIRAKAAELTKGLTDDNAKLHAIYNYVSLRFRYIAISFGIGRYQPHAADDVLSNQYGDCKDKHTLFASLLDAAGIKAYPALISSAREVDEDVPSPSQFNHVITVVPQGDKFQWLDTTPEVSPFGYLISPLRGKHALVMQAGHPAVLAMTPTDPPFMESQTFKIEGKLDSTGTFDGRFNRTDRGESEVVLRQIFRQIPQEKWKDVVQQVSYATGFGGTVSDINAGSPEEIDAPFHFSYSYERKNFGGDWENHRITPPVPYILLPTLKDETAKPTRPIFLGPPKEIVTESRLQLPEGYSAELPRDINLVKSFGEYHSSFTMEDREFVIKVTFKNKGEEVPVNQYDEYKSFVKAIGDDRDQYVQLSTATQINSPEAQASKALLAIRRDIRALPNSLSADAMRYESDGLVAQEARNFPGAIQSLSLATTEDSKFARAWLELGSIYAGSQQEDNAINAFRRGIEAAPKERIGYKLLGLTFMSTRRYEEAVKVWQDLGNLGEDDSTAYANLGTALMHLQRWDESAKALEAAVKEPRPTAHLYNLLGQAYLHSNHDDKALAAFGEAFKLEPGGDSQNDAAYELAEAGKKLPEALSFAQQAVHEVEATSQHIDLSNLTEANLKLMNTLSMYWDTLGWVYFKKGDLPRAERALNAAWVLTLNGIVGDHLGQVYEAEHRPSDAIRMYKLALAADGKLVDTKTRLNKLEPATAKPVPWNQPDLSSPRTYKLPRLFAGKASGEVFILFSPGKVEEVKFISGTDKVKAATKLLMNQKFNVPFPEGSSAHILRRGILSCFEVTGCSFVAYTPEDVHSVN